MKFFQIENVFCHLGVLMDYGYETDRSREDEGR